MKAMSEEQVSLTERVFEEVRAAISSGELAPGSLHSVVELSKQLGVSRTPVREALLHFAANGVVRFERSRGVRILELSVKDIEDIYSLRLMLEVPSAFRAATEMTKVDRAVFDKAFSQMRKATDAADELLFQKHDPSFHEVILRAAGNDRVVEAVAKTRTQMHALGLSTTASRSLQDVFAAHEAIHDRITDRDAEGSARAVRDHLLGTLTVLVKQASGKDVAASEYEWIAPSAIR